jgi:hypothetical protein
MGKLNKFAAVFALGLLVSATGMKSGHASLVDLGPAAAGGPRRIWGDFFRSMETFKTQQVTIRSIARRC